MTEWILSSSVLILVVLVLRAALKGNISLRLRYVLWSIVLLRLLIPFSLTGSAISIAGMAQHPITQIETIVREPIRSDAYDAAVAEVTAQFFSQQMDPSTLSREELDTAIRQNVYDKVVSEQTLSPSPMTSQQIEAEIDSRMEEMYSVDPAGVLTAAWLAGAAIMCAVFLYANVRLALNLRKTRKPLQISHNLPVYMTDYVATPCLFGLLRSAIYLPREAAESPNLHHILAHESTHHRQGDHIWSVLRCLCLALHWYNPLVWVAAAASKKDAELACDEATIAHLGENQRTAYGETLITMTCARRNHKDLFLTATTMNTGKRTLKERVTMIAKHPKTAVYTLIAVILVMALAVGCTFTGPGSQEDSPTVTTEPTETTEPQEIITDTPVPDETVSLSDIRSFPEGEIQAVLIWVNNNLYVRSETALEHTLPEGCTLLGTVQSVNNRIEPKEEFHAVHLSTGTEIYAIPRTESMIFVKDSDTGLYFRMHLTIFVDNWWRKQPQENSTPGFTDFTPQGTAADAETYDAIAALFADYRSWYTMATTSCYMTPEEVDLSLLFYNGIFREQVTLTDAEKQYLNNTWLGFEIGKLEFDRIKADDMDDVLWYHFGIGLDDSIKWGAQSMVYWDKTDCYYQAHNDFLDQRIDIQGIYIRNGGMVDVYYRSGISADPEYYVMTLQLVDNRFVIRSNWYADERITLPEPTARFGICVPGDYDASRPLSQAELDYFNDLFKPGRESIVLSAFLNCYYESPRDLDLTEFLRYNSLAREIHSGSDFDAICKKYGYDEYVPTPIWKYEADEVDDCLELYMGIGLDDLKNRRGGDGLTYLHEYDAYYNTTSDAGASSLAANRGEYKDGKIILYRDFDNGGVEYLVLKVQGAFALIDSHMLAIPG